MILRAGKDLLGYFVEFGTSDQLDIAYSDSSKHSSRLSNGITHGLHMDHSMITIQWCKNLSFLFTLGGFWR